MTTEPDETILALTADIVAAHVGNNIVAIEDLPMLIKQVHAALATAGDPVVQPEAEPQPAVPIRGSVKPDYIICLEDGKKLKMLRRYLRTRFDMSPEQYRAKWKLPETYPMVAPNYTEQRRALANAIGLGRKPAAPAPTPAPAPKKRGRKPATATAA
ncbi:MAG TPA: MucR family transcriptional regulator [Sphingomonas sp.]|jgi:predicted transcriptional regulator|uniref:MucR family transcriptional regulator n=1 Tax=Sphingomonas sp. TaxID=28214 RepID=UPI002ED832F1